MVGLGTMLDLLEVGHERPLTACVVFPTANLTIEPRRFCYSA